MERHDGAANAMALLAHMQLRSQNALPLCDRSLAAQRIRVV
jgi:hypothetical protein